jgi:hypothetical protein
MKLSLCLPWRNIGELVYRPFTLNLNTVLGWIVSFRRTNYEGFGEEKQVLGKKIYLTRERNRTMFPQSSRSFIIPTTTLF